MSSSLSPFPSQCNGLLGLFLDASRLQDKGFGVESPTRLAQNFNGYYPDRWVTAGRTEMAEIITALAAKDRRR